MHTLKCLMVFWGKIRLKLYHFKHRASKNFIYVFRAHRDYWEKLNPSTGRPFSAALSKPDAWGVTKGDLI